MKTTRKNCLNYFIIGILFIFTLVVLEPAVIAYEPYRIKVDKVDVDIPDLPSKFEGFTIVQVSDLHRSKVVKRPYIEQMIAMIKNLHPDAIVITGDLANNLLYLSDVVKTLDTLSAPYGVFVVLGNWEHYYGVNESIEVIKKSKLRLLFDKVVYLKKGDQKICLAGVSDDGGRGTTLKETYKKVDDKYVKILLAHNPYIVVNRHKSNRRIDLILSGHTHGGQVVLPFWGPIVVPRAFNKKYPSGMFYFDDSKLYVNRGIGAVTFPMRVNCPPEITLFTLKKEIKKDIIKDTNKDNKDKKKDKKK
ncbi:MAG: metallophosphoesterase [Vampirovibrionia bacterium]